MSLALDDFDVCCLTTSNTHTPVAFKDEDDWKLEMLYVSVSVKALRDKLAIKS
jgi:hypothetical protein